MKIKRKVLRRKLLDVYDITSPETSNFALANGCIVHNSHGSKDIADAIAGSFYACFKNMVGSAMPKQVEFAQKMVEDRKKSGNFKNRSMASIYAKLF